jgi:hypothetical protein
VPSPHVDGSVFRPSFEAYRDYLNIWDHRRGSVVVWIIPGTIIATFISAFAIDHTDEWWPFVATGIFAVAGLYLYLFFRVTRITATPERLEVRNALGHVNSRDRAALARMILMPSYQIPMRYTTIQVMRAIVIDSTGRSALSLLASGWSEHQMEAIAKDLGLPLERISRQMDAAALRKLYPRTVPLWTAHIFLTALIITSVILVLGGIAIAIDIAVEYN